MGKTIKQLNAGKKKRKGGAEAAAEEAKRKRQGKEPQSQQKPADVRDKAKPNDAFTKFYRANLVDTGALPDKEWAEFIDVMAKPLPTTFWITPTDSRAAAVKEQLHEFRRKAEQLEQDNPDGVKVTIRTIPWIPNDMAWFIDAPRVTLRKDPVFSELHLFLIRHNERGVISRQEEASMVPVHLLDVGHNARCLDLCAAPGSKTAQMLASLADANYQKYGRGASPNVDTVRLLNGRVDYSEDNGLVVANDMSAERVNILVHQIKRLSQLYPLAVFTSHDARFFPSLKDCDTQEEIPFTHILCDVMCSGDGTLRKAPHMWRDWNPKQSLLLHNDQVRIALRAARLCGTGGRVVYSTCSLSPIENEAAVVHILRKTKGSLRLLDARKLITIPSFPGLSSWRVMCPKTQQMYATAEEAAKAGASVLRPWHFPPSPEDPVAQELGKCLRLIPGEGRDFGGFFVAVFEKMRDLPHTQKGGPADDVADLTESDVACYESDADEDEEAIEREKELTRLQGAVKKTEQNPVEHAKAKAKLGRMLSGGSLHRELAKYRILPQSIPGAAAYLVEAYGIKSDFPLHQLICRYHLELQPDGSTHQPHDGMPNQILYLAKAAADAIRFATSESARRPWRIVSGGLRFLVKDRLVVKAKQDQEVDDDQGQLSKKFGRRFAQEAVELVLPYVSNRVVRLSDTEDVTAVVTDKKKCRVVAEIKSEEERNAVALLPQGGCIVLLRTPSGKFLPVSGLKTKNAINLYVDDADMVDVKKLCGAL